MLLSFLGIVFVIILLFILLVKTKIEIQLYNKNYIITIILFMVIKIRINAETIDDLNEKRESKTKKIKIGKKDIFDIIKASLNNLKYLLSKVILKVDLNISFYIFSADKTAILYGVMNLILYNTDILLNNVFKTYLSSYKLAPDFNKRENNISANFEISIRNINALIFVFKMLPILFKYKKIIKNKGGEYNGASYRGFNENYNG